MPELAEVAHACARWKTGLNQRVQAVLINPRSRVFRECQINSLYENLPKSTLRYAQAHGKQMLFGFSGNLWLGAHLGMTGSLDIQATEYAPSKHDALVLRQPRQSLVFRDPRQFGRIRFEKGKEKPEWWKSLPVPMLHLDFRAELIRSALKRHAKRPIKALLLDQRYFPGMGNWMADEVLWRARIHPACKSGDLEEGLRLALFRQILFVCRGAMRTVGSHGGDPPSGWLFHQRWKDGGICPKSNCLLVRDTIGGRTSCWSPALQVMN